MKYTATDTQTRKSNTSSQGSTLTATAPITKKYIKKGDPVGGGEQIYIYIYIVYMILINATNGHPF